MVLIEFDDAKDELNRRKHGCSLALAAEFTVSARSMPAKTVKGEARWLLVGLIRGELMSAVVTPRGRRLRVISLRGASRQEIRAYESS